jgi:hypothetical protein
MRSLSKMSSEPNLYGSSKGGSPSSRSSNKSFGASIPARKSIASYKLSSKVRNILSKELGGSSSTGGGASANIYGYGNVTSDDSSFNQLIQPDENFNVVDQKPHQCLRQCH